MNTKQIISFNQFCFKNTDTMCDGTEIDRVHDGVKTINLALIEKAIDALKLGIQVPFNIKHGGIIFTIANFDDENFYDKDERGGFASQGQLFVIIYPEGCKI
jgi:hypothetical protein